jgi:hypothetical protein
MERCVCCARPLSIVARYGDWCHNCLNGLILDANLMRAGDKDELGMTVSWLLDKGCLTLSRFVTTVPFDCGDSRGV